MELFARRGDSNGEQGCVHEPSCVPRSGAEYARAVERGETDNFSLARNTSKTAVSKRYFATTGGKKGLVHSTPAET